MAGTLTPADMGPVSDGLGPEPRTRDAACSTRELVRRLELGGLARGEAGNIVGLLHGLRPVRCGWTIHEIEHLRFVRALVEDDRLGPARRG